VPALAAGAIVGLVLIAVVTFVLVSRSRQMPQAALPTPVATSVGLTLAGTAPPSNSPITGRYKPEDIIAWVNGQPYSLADLEKVVRVARVLAHFTGDAVPSDNSPDMPGYQVQMLRRQIDVMLLKQAMDQQHVAAPTADPAMLVQAFLRDTKGATEDMQAQMTANGVTEADLEAWFRDARAVDFYIQNNLMAGQNAANRDAIVKKWLDDRWGVAGAVVIRFYDPDEVLPKSTPTVPRATP
jgi:hypothetical protein